MTVNKLYEALSARILPELSCEWDNDGRMCVPCGEREVRRVLITLDVTEGAAAHAIECGCDLIIAHHPFIFKGLSALDEENYISRKAIKLVRAGISVFSFHTRLDAVQGGVNDTLCALLGIENAAPFGDGEIERIGRVGTLPKDYSLEEFAALVKEKLGAPCVLCADAGVKVRRVAVFGGGGADGIASAVKMGADTYVSGDIGYHRMTDAPEGSINMIEAGHFFTENPVCASLADMLGEIDSSIECELYFSNTIKAI